MQADLLYVAAPRDDVVEIADLLGGRGGRPVGHVLMASKPWSCLVVADGAGAAVAGGLAKISGRSVYLLEVRDDSCHVARFNSDGSAGPRVNGSEPEQIKALAAGVTGISAPKLEAAFAAPAGTVAGPSSCRTARGRLPDRSHSRPTYWVGLRSR